MSASVEVLHDPTYTPLTFQQRVVITSGAHALAAAYLSELRLMRDQRHDGPTSYLLRADIARAERVYAQIEILMEDHFQEQLRKLRRGEA